MLRGSVMAKAASLDRTYALTVLIGLVPLLALWLWRRFWHVPLSERAVRFSWSVPPEAKKGWRSKALAKPSILAHLDDPSLLPSGATEASAFITCYAPASGHVLEVIPSASESQIKDAITRAQLAQREFRNSTFAQRRQILRSLLDWCVRDMDNIARVSCRDSGKTMLDAGFGEILTTCEKLRWTIQNGERYLKPEKRSTSLITMAHKTSYLHYEPLGVVAAIVSWNYPFHNMIAPIISSIMTGNAIIVKPSENVAWSSHRYIEAIQACLKACGHSPDLAQIVTCLPNTVEALTGDPRLGHITFIGSEVVGQKVAIKAAEAGTPVVLELGGKDPCIVLPSADLDYFGATMMRGTFQAAGQNCIGAERFIVADEIYDDFVKQMTQRCRLIKPGDELADGSGKNRTDLERIDMGAMVSDRLFNQLEEMVAEAVKEGARLVQGGKRWIHPEFPTAHYFEPTLLVDVKPSMRIAQEELFAPVMTVIRSSSLDEAIAIANGTRYGLGASVFGKNLNQCRRVVREIKSGMVSVNDFAVFYLNQSLPFGGTAASGYGRFAGPEGLRGLCNLKAVCEDRFHGYLQTGIPPQLAYPIRNADVSWRFFGGLVLFAYASTIKERLVGIWRLAMTK